MLQARLRHALVAVLLLVAMLVQGTPTLAGTTGALSGTVYESNGSTPIANAQVTATSPSQTTTAQTDAGGHFSFVSLAPDTYTVNVAKDGYEPVSTTGVTVFADQTQTISMNAPKKLKEIGSVTSRSASDLVKAGTTSDVYSVNQAQAQRVAALGGGGGLNNAYSAIASVPGAYVPLNQNGYYQTVHVRGGDYDQVGYELDGVPVNRSFDNYPAGTASSLGQQELQVYTGASPANSEGQGLAGYINQVIRTGTNPGFGDIHFGLGSPNFYHKLAAEVGGATPNRNFSYYLGLGGFNQDNFQYVDQNQGATYTNNYGNVLGCSGPAGAVGFCSPFSAANTYVMSPLSTFTSSGLSNRDAVANFHIGIPHRKDAGRDDIQILVDSQSLHTEFYDSANDQGLTNLNLIGQTTNPYPDSATYNGPIGAFIPGASLGTGAAGLPSALFTPYYFPSSPVNRCVNVGGFSNSCGATPAVIPNNARDTIWNNQEIVKIQYQKNFSSNAFFRIYGYSYYSDWLQNGPMSQLTNYFGPSGPDYELFTHTRGMSASFADQINDKNLINVQGSYSTASSVRNNNHAFARLGSAQIVDSTNPMNGYCYDATGTPQTCNGTAQTLAPGAALTPIAPGTVCGAGPCSYLAVENGLNGPYNSVVPKFGSYSITDQFKPTDRWLFNLGLRLDSFTFNGSQTTGGARPFWFNAYNNNNCVNPATGGVVDKVGIGAGITPTTTCGSIPVAGSAGTFYTTPALTNASGQSFTYNVFQPRIAGTYNANPDTVLRFSFGKYAEPPSTAYEQYNTQQQDLADFLGKNFYQFGFTTPGHAVRPSISYNTDFSYERHIKGTDWSLKLTPFLRKTQDQIENFFLDQKTGFVSGLNVGQLTAKGIEFQLNKGDFAKNGFAGQLAFTYTDARVKYNSLPNGTTVVSQINQDVKNYNAYTSFCATHTTDSRCAGGATQTGSSTGAPCYAGGVADPTCAAGSVANPYWNAPVQDLLDAGASYVPYDIFPGGIGSTADGYNVPYVAALILNYKKDRLAITPSFQFAAGSRYGSPESTPGIAPDLCGAPFAATIDAARYPYGAPGGGSFDATNCGVAAGNSIAIPNPFSGTFDRPGAFRNPSQFVANLQMTYQASNRVSLIGTFANLINRCFGGDSRAWTGTDSNFCSYGTLGSGVGSIQPIGNQYNPGMITAATPAFIKYPYEPGFGPVNVDGNSNKQPFTFFFEAQIKI